MVIPIPGGNLMGPPSAEVEPLFKKIKVCVMAMIGCTVGKWFAALLLGQFLPVLLASMNVVLNCVIGIFLLRHDEQMGRMADFLVRTFCQQCPQQVGGGLSCLMFFVVCNAVTVVMDLLGGSIYQLFAVFLPIAMSPEAWPNDFFGLGVVLFFITSMGSTISQCVGAYYGFEAYKQVASTGASQSGGGNYMPPAFQPSMGGNAGRSGQPAPQASRQWGFGGATAGGDTFKPFSGAGQRLGGGP